MNFYELECYIVIGLQIQDHEADIIIIKELQFSGFKSASMNRSVLFVCD